MAQASSSRGEEVSERIVALTFLLFDVCLMVKAARDLRVYLLLPTIVYHPKSSLTPFPISEHPAL
jgi:hypothetical protein